MQRPHPQWIQYLGILRGEDAMVIHPLLGISYVAGYVPPVVSVLTVVVDAKGWHHSHSSQSQ